MISAEEITSSLQARGFHIDQIAGRIVGALPIADEELQVLVHRGNGGCGWDTYWRRRPGCFLVLHVWLPSDMVAALERDVPDWLARPLPCLAEGQ